MHEAEAPTNRTQVLKETPPYATFQTWGGFLKVISVGIPTYAGVKTGSVCRAEVGIETGFHAGIDR